MISLVTYLTNYASIEGPAFTITINFEKPPVNEATQFEKPISESIILDFSQFGYIDESTIDHTLSDPFIIGVLADKEGDSFDV